MIVAPLERFGLWRGPPITLASRSAGRAQLLRAAGVPFEIVDSRLDERCVSGVAELDPHTQAATLAREKAHIVSAARPGRVVLGADQILSIDGRTLHKARDRDEALAQLRELGGKTHNLYSAVACLRDGAPLFEAVGVAEIRMRNLSARALVSYANAMGDRLLATVGGYEIEGLGANIVESVSGDMFTVIGLPMLQLLSGFRAIGLIDEEGGSE